MRLKLTLFLVTFSLVAHAQDWTLHARRLVGESQAARKNALAELEKWPGLDEQLMKSLGGPNHFLALEAITGLERRTLIPQLLDWGLRDGEGQTLLTINALMDGENKPDILSHYQKWLENQYHVLTGPMICAILDPMGRLGEGLKNSRVFELLKNPTYEVRSCTFQYLRKLFLAGKLKDIKKFLPALIVLSPYQLRIETWMFLKEKPRAMNRDIQRKWCRSEKNSEVVGVCQNILKIKK